MIQRGEKGDIVLFGQIPLDIPVFLLSLCDRDSRETRDEGWR
jgi:hypothetical protein